MLPSIENRHEKSRLCPGKRSGFFKYQPHANGEECMTIIQQFGVNAQNSAITIGNSTTHIDERQYVLACEVTL